MVLRNFGYVLDGQLAGLAHPGRGGGLDETLIALRDLGITALVSLDEAGISSDVVRRQGLDHLHLPVPDFEPPTIKQAERFTDYVDEQVARGGQVAVHCGAGIGRTGTMLSAYLIATGMSSADAINLVRQRRRGSVESTTQLAFLQEFARHRSPGD
jgi:atypical dual specificity phosphatase